MRCRTPEELSAHLDEDAGFRKRELVTLELKIDEVKQRKHILEAMLRSTYLLVYAHFEGFVKRSSDAYLGHIEAAGYSMGALSPNFTALAIKSNLLEFGATKKATLLTRIVNEFASSAVSTSGFTWRGEIDTHSNVTSDVLEEILCLIGVSSVKYKTKHTFIDKKLIVTRNAIAHGGRDVVDIDDLREAKTIVLDMIDSLRIDIYTAAANWRLKSAYPKGRPNESGTAGGS